MPYAADDFAAIRAALDAQREEAVPKCPFTPALTLYRCLRSPAKCVSSCPHHADWIGPEEKLDAQNAAAGAYC